MLKMTAGVLAWLYVPLMAVLAALFALLGLVGLLAPWKLRNVVTLGARTRSVRATGILFLLIGAEVFVRARGTPMTTGMQVLGTLLFVDGGVRIVIPTVHIVIAEHLAARSDHWYRLVGAVYLGLAYLLYLAAQIPLVKAP